MTKQATDMMQRVHGANIYAGFVPTFATDLQGWHSQHPLFRKVIAELRPSVVIDVGVWKGASTIVLAGMLKEAAIDGVVISIDTFLGSLEHASRKSPMYGLIPRRHGLPLLYEQFLANVIRSELQEFIVPLPQTTDVAAAILKALGVSAGVIHIDASHDYESVLRDARAYWQVLEPGGFLIGDDYDSNWPGVVRAADEFACEIGQPLVHQLPKWIVQKTLAA